MKWNLKSWEISNNEDQPVDQYYPISWIMYMSRDMTKPAKLVCTQQRLRSAWASAQSDLSLRCPHEESLGP